MQEKDEAGQADKIFRRQEPEAFASNLNILGTVYYYNQQPAQARMQFDEALDIYKKEHKVITKRFSFIGRRIYLGIRC